jgi:hypothetical protein
MSKRSAAASRHGCRRVFRRRTRKVVAAMSTLSAAIDDFADQGFTEHFGVRGRRLRGLDSGVTFEAHEVVICDFERFEGVSDPDDMSIVYAIETRTGMRGTLTDAFGVYSNPVISAFVNDVAIGPR